MLWLLALCVVVNAFLPTLGQYPIHFNCPQLPPLTKPARNVYELKPQDIKVVMAFGDSITAGPYFTI